MSISIFTSPVLYPLLTWVALCSSGLLTMVATVTTSATSAILMTSLLHFRVMRKFPFPKLHMWCKFSRLVPCNALLHHAIDTPWERLAAIETLVIDEMMASHTAGWNFQEATG